MLSGVREEWGKEREGGRERTERREKWRRRNKGMRNKASEVDQHILRSLQKSQWYLEPRSVQSEIYKRCLMLYIRFLPPGIL